ncbi:MAG TPA: hypothetical protein EYG16_03185 [Deltaproteobacteria bacterium]|jgi:hypothetical protein|nr:hypothetical protein [Candidatus Binatota bacterium]HIL12656.1 hypothetical protein [Deltaproteobacteria bacterium]
MLQKFVLITGALDYLVGLATWGGALAAPAPDHFVANMTLGMFLMMAAACLVWASKDIAARAPVIVWQGLVRLTAVASVIYAVPAGLAHPGLYALVVFDGVIGLVYVFGTQRFTGQPMLQLLAWRS